MKIEVKGCIINTDCDQFEQAEEDGKCSDMIEVAIDAKNDKELDALWKKFKKLECKTCTITFETP
jgi:hypothetical protein